MNAAAKTATIQALTHFICSSYQPPKIAVKSAIQHLPLFKSKSFLWQKYVVENLSIAEVADIIGAAESSVHKYLRKYEIPVRDPGDNIQRQAGRGLKYGRRIAQRQEVDHKRELEAVTKMRSLRDQGFSYWKIAGILNAMKVPTKTRRGRWHARSVQQILKGTCSEVNLAIKRPLQEAGL